MFTQEWLLEVFTVICIEFSWCAFVILVAGFAERRWPAGEHASISDCTFNFVLAFVVSILLAISLRPLGVVHAFLATHGWAGILVGSWRPQTLPEILIATLLYALVWDFFQYWVHRAQHRVSYLWLAHALHHDDERVNASTALRNTFWNGIINLLLIHIPTYIFCGSSLLVVYASMFLFATYGFFNHANIKLKMGMLSMIFSGPMWHRIHHGKPIEYYDKNFAAFFPIYDVIFGTYKAPDEKAVFTTGLSNYPQAKGNFISLLLAMFGFRRDK